MSLKRYAVLSLFLCGIAACKDEDAPKKENSVPNAANGNNAPIARDDDANTAENTAVTIDVLQNDSDPDGDMLSITEVMGADDGTATIAGDRISFTPSSGFAGATSFQYTVSDEFGATATATVNVSVLGEPNDPPIAMDDIVMTLAGVPVEIDVLANDSDVNGDPLTITMFTEPQLGSIVLDGDTFAYTPPAMGGNDFFTYTIDDAHQSIAVGRVFITINGPPEANDDEVDMLVDTTIQIEVLLNDIEPETEAMTVESITPTSNGTATLAGNLVEYTPNAGYEGLDGFDYVVSDPNGLTSTGSVTIEVVPPFRGFSFSAGDSHACEVRANGTLVCWGRGGDQLGLGSFQDATSPAQVGGATDWQSVDTGQYHTCGVRQNGTLWCWGQNSDGELGIPGQNSTNAPLQVGTETDWGSVAAGDSHTCAVKTDGQLYCVGENRDGQAGADRTSSLETFTRVGTEFGWVQVDAGYQHTCGVRGAGTLWCWGQNRSGQLGQANDDRGTNAPARVGAAEDWSRVTTGYEHTCGLRNGELYCWGSGRSGELGTGGTSDVVSPSRIGSESDWTHVSAGREHSCGVRGGQAWCWGSNEKGQLGNGTLADSLIPVRVGTDSDWVDVVAGWQFSCGRKTNGAQLCWGRHQDGQLGIGDTVSRLTPQQVGSATNWSYVEASGVATCGVSNTGDMSCWGFNGDGQLANNSTADAQTPTPSLGGGNWAMLGHGPETHCGIKDNGALYCWGNNWLGMLGDGTSTDKLVPTRITSQTYISSDGGRQHSCAVQTNGSMWCWGRNTRDQLGLDPAIIESQVPVQIGTDLDWEVVDAGEWGNCGLKAGGVYCWGDQLGGVPIQQGVDTDFAQLSMGGREVCAIKTDNTLWCWNAGTTPAQVGADSDWRFISADSERHNCGIRMDNSLWCWGENRSGELGDGTTVSRGAPGQVGFDSDWTHVTAAGGVFNSHTCGTRSNGQLYCWGNNDYAQLGLGGAWFPTPQTITP